MFAQTSSVRARLGPLASRAVGDGFLHRVIEKTMPRSETKKMVWENDTTIKFPVTQSRGPEQTKSFELALEVKSVLPSGFLHT
jgi:hypothetical protein